MNNSLPIKKILTSLEKSRIVSNIETFETDHVFGAECCKIHCKLFPTRYRLNITLLKTDCEFNYSYRLTQTLTEAKFVPGLQSPGIPNTGDPDPILAKWDNTPHYPHVETYPHHFHDEKGRILLSNIEGNAESIRKDLKIVLHDITEFIEKTHGTYIPVEELRITVT